MPNRRDVLKQTVAAGVVAATSLNVGQAAVETAAVNRQIKSKVPPTPVSRVKSIIRREETILRLGGAGDCWHMTWAADDRQFVALNDGTGWSKNPKEMYNSRLFAISGGPRDATFQDVPGYPDLPFVANTREQNRYYGFGTLALDGRIYQFLGTPNCEFMRPDWTPLGAHFVGAKLIYSPDNGRSWCNQDGSTPVVWERWQSRSRQNMVFFEEPQAAFSLLSILQMGRNYEANRDGYVYVYSTNGNTDGTMNELVMLRVPKAQILDRGAYEYFAGLRPDGNANWTKDIRGRGIVHTFPRGWVNRFYHPWAWLPSVAYNAPLGLYMMVNWGMGVAPDGQWFGKPSYFGVWVASNPWGPWTQVHEETAWLPDHNPAARAYAPQIAPKWIAPDGKSFWLVWTDLQGYSEMLQETERVAKERKPTDTDKDFQRKLEESLRARSPKPVSYYSFNTQRVDLVIS